MISNVSQLSFNVHVEYQCIMYYVIISSPFLDFLISGKSTRIYFHACSLGTYLKIFFHEACSAKGSLMDPPELHGPQNGLFVKNVGLN